MGRFAEHPQIAGLGRHAAHVAHHRLHNHGGDSGAMGAKGPFHGFRRVEGQRDGGVAEGLGDTLGIGDPKGGEPGTGLHQQGIHVAVIAAFEFDDEVAAGEAARHPDGRHGGFGAGVHQAHHFDRRHGAANGLRQFDFPLGGSAETGSDGERAFDGRENRGVAMAEQQRTPGADVIDVLVAIDVEDVRPLAARDENGVAADAAESADGGIDAAGNDLLGAAEELFGFGVSHTWSFRGTMRLKPRLMPMS